MKIHLSETEFLKAELKRLQDDMQALAAPVQEPVAWQVMVEDEAMKEFSIKDIAHDWCIQQKLVGSPYSYWIRPLYTAAQRQWVGLTDEEIFSALGNLQRKYNGPPTEDSRVVFALAIEAKLKEKNT
jgi:hypothetical protein